MHDGHSALVLMHGGEGLASLHGWLKEENGDLIEHKLANNKESKRIEYSSKSFNEVY